MKRYAIVLCLICTLSGAARADTFGSGANSFNIDFVTIGNPGNPADTTGAPNPAGKVNYAYRMGKYEISEDMINKANILGGLGITHNGFGANKPAMSVSWFEAAKFVNWLNTSGGSTAAYKFDGTSFQLWSPADPGYNPNNLLRNSLAKYFLTDVHEWYKAAYYNPTTGTYFDYPTGSNTQPTPVASGTAPGTAVWLQFTGGPADVTQAGGLSPYGTMGQGGNAYEWQETTYDYSNSHFGAMLYRGCSWTCNTGLDVFDQFFVFPGFENYTLGFRVASVVPEPSSLLLAALAGCGLLWRRRNSRCFCILAAIAGISLIATQARADTFGSGANTFNIDFVTIGNPGNPGDTTGDPNPIGSVPHIYRMGKFEISTQMIDKANVLGGLGIARIQPVAADNPMLETSWNEAARFVNWLNTSTGSAPAYKFAVQPGDIGYSANADIELWTLNDAGYDPNNLFRNSFARYFLPSEDEWYKAAYYDPITSAYFDYPTGSNIAPTPATNTTAAGTAVYSSCCIFADVTLAGGLSPYGTMGQGGNVWEWGESEIDRTNDFSVYVRGVRGGDRSSSALLLSSSHRNGNPPNFHGYGLGFRVASGIVPEPSSLMLLMLGGSALLLRRRTTRSANSVILSNDAHA